MGIEMSWDSTFEGFWLGSKTGMKTWNNWIFKVSSQDDNSHQEYVLIKLSWISLKSIIWAQQSQDGQDRRRQTISIKAFTRRELFRNEVNRGKYCSLCMLPVAMLTQNPLWSGNKSWFVIQHQCHVWSVSQPTCFWEKMSFLVRQGVRTCSVFWEGECSLRKRGQYFKN